ncbi:MAG: MFS transporter [Chloroflexi bacterium]|nr:MFS transporter [Chloroflexota bacterium]
MDDSKKLFRTLAFANFFLYLGFNVWQAVFNNFAVEELGIGADQIGIIQSVREIPGLLGFVLAFLALYLSEMRVMGVSLLLLGIGIMMTGVSDTLSLLMISTLVMSTGFHFFYPCSNSLVLMGSSKEEAPKVLGRLSGISSFASVLGTIVIWLFVEGSDIGPIHFSAWGYRTTFLVIGGIVTAGSLFAIRNGRRYNVKKEKRKVVFRAKYWLYYALTFLLGSRRHIFYTFAIFLLVDVYGIGVRETAMLFLVNNLVSTFTLPQLGKLVAKFGERKVLTWNFVGLTGVFLGYAYIPNLPILCVLFILDNVFMGFSLALESYFQKIVVSQEEITGNVSMGQTINHISALIVPVVGGILWEQIAPSATFLFGVVVAVISLVLVQFIPRKFVKEEVLTAPAQ